MNIILLVIGVIIIAWLISYSRDINKTLASREAELRGAREEIDKQTRTYKARIADCEKKEQELAQKAQEKEQALEKRAKDLDDRESRLHRVIEEKIESYPYIASVKAFLDVTPFETEANYLENKVHPALTAAETVRNMRDTAQTLATDRNLAQYRLNYLLTIYPELSRAFTDPDAYASAANVPPFSELVSLERFESQKADIEKKKDELEQLDTLLASRYENCLLSNGNIKSMSETFSGVSTAEQLKRLVRLLDVNKLYNIEHTVKATVQSSDSRETYTTTLESCTCPAFQFGNKAHQPCKHMYRLALEIGMLPIAANRAAPNFERILGQLRLELSELEKKTSCCEAAWAKAAGEQLRLQKENEKLAGETSQRFPWLAEKITQLRLQQIDVVIRDSVTREKMTRELKLLTRENEELKNQISFYEYIFPALEEFKTMPPANAIKAAKHEPGELPYQWLSQEEYAALSRPEKLQLWLDNYFDRRSKNSWEAGIKYERYIGYLCEKAGYTVKYTGATLKLNDMGRDLVVRKGKNVYIVQCKRYNEDKETHENHIFQLFGSVVHYAHDHGKSSSAVGVFVTTSSLSSVARECADVLGIKVYEHVDFKKYPLIKCNVGRDGEKIYHMPFDQQYDTTAISFKNEECYVETASEAERLGFRHAMKHTAWQQ